MGFFARPDLSDVQFKQSNDSILTLSGQTRIISPSGLTLMGQSGYVPIDISTNNINDYILTYENDVIKLKAPSVTGDTTSAINIGSGIGVYSGLSGTTLLFRSLVGSGDTSISQVGNNIIVSSSGGSSTYNLSSPSTCSVGGISAGTDLTGKTAFQLFEQLLAPELYGTVSAPSLSITLTVSGIVEIGCTISQTVTGNFNRGSINPQYCSLSPYRSGVPNAYCFTGSGMPSGFQSCTNTSACQINPSYTVVSGSQSWGVCTSYDAGLPALGSTGTEYCAALPSGCTSPSNGSITGILPWYWGTSSTSTVIGSDITGGTKTVANIGASTPITFNATTEYLWFAAPQGTYTPKTKWWVCAANAGNIGGVGDLWAAACSVSVNSGQGCWSGCLFDVYVTCGITSTPTGISMCLYY